MGRSRWSNRWMLLAMAIVALLAAAAACGAKEARPPGAPIPTPALFEREVVREVPVERVVVEKEVALAEQAPFGLPSPPRPSATPRPSAIAAGGLALPQVQERLIVRTASLEVLAEDVQDAVRRIAQLAADLNGLVVSSRLFGDPENRSGTITIRVPVQETDNALDAIRDIATEVKEENLQSQDVTEEFVDLQARLRNLRASEAQMQELMNRADKVGDVLNVLRELTLIREQIEQLEGRVQFLERTAATSKITVTVRSTTIGLEDLSPRQARQGAEDVAITLFGFGFEEGATFFLRRQGEEEIRPSSAPRIFSSTRMQGVFDIPGDARVGAWDVVAEVRGIQSKPLTNAFIVEEGEEGWSVIGVLKDAALSLRVLATGGLWALVFSPLWLGVMLGLWLVGRRTFRTRS